MEPYETDRLAFLMHAQSTYGGMVRFDSRTTIVNDALLAHELLMDRAGRYPISQNFLQQGIPETEQAEWLSARRLLNPHLRATVARRFASTVADVTESFFDTAATKNRETPVRAMDLMEAITSTSIAKFFFDDNDSEEIPSAVAQLLNALSVVIGNPFALPSRLPTPARRRINRHFMALEELVAARVFRRATQPDTDRDFVSAVLASRDEANGHTLARITKILIGSLLAAHRVPAAGASWVLMEAATTPGLWNALQRQAAQPAADGVRPGAGDLGGAVVAESLRLHPPTWLISRTCVRAVSVGRYEFPAGHNFLISPYVLHRDPEPFPEPERFSVDRWMGNTPSRSVNYMPFGAGPRSCPGNHLATQTLTAILGTVTSRYEISLSGSVSPDPRTTLSPRDLMFRVRALKQLGRPSATTLHRPPPSSA